jgi:hypothetical protein
VIPNGRVAQALEDNVRVHALMQHEAGVDVPEIVKAHGWELGGPEQPGEPTGEP